MADNKQLQIAKSNKLFDGLQEDSLSRIIKNKNFITVNEGIILYSSGDNTSDVYLMIEGEVKLKFSENRKVEFKDLFDFFGEAEVLSNKNRISSAIANTNCLLYKINVDELKSIISKYPVIKNNLKRINSIGNNEFSENVIYGSEALGTAGS